jgi:hypothetical protein
LDTQTEKLERGKIRIASSAGLWHIQRLVRNKKWESKESDFLHIKQNYVFPSCKNKKLAVRSMNEIRSIINEAERLGISLEEVDLPLSGVCRGCGNIVLAVNGSSNQSSVNGAGYCVSCVDKHLEKGVR